MFIKKLDEIFICHTLKKKNVNSIKPVISVVKGNTGLLNTECLQDNVYVSLRIISSICFMTSIPFNYHWLPSSLWNIFFTRLRDHLISLLIIHLHRCLLFSLLWYLLFTSLKFLRALPLDFYFIFITTYLMSSVSQILLSMCYVYVYCCIFQIHIFNQNSPLNSKQINRSNYLLDTSNLIQFPTWRNSTWLGLSCCSSPSLNLLFAQSPPSQEIKTPSPNKILSTCSTPVLLLTAYICYFSTSFCLCCEKIKQPVPSYHVHCFLPGTYHHHF